MAYIEPDAAALKLQFRVFAAVDDVTVEYWLTDARLIVVDTWVENDRGPAEMLLAAHNLALYGAGSSGGAVSSLAAIGVTDLKSASMLVSYSAEAVRRAREDARQERCAANRKSARTLAAPSAASVRSFEAALIQQRR